jgi:hypothetical protein
MCAASSRNFRIGCPAKSSDSANRATISLRIEPDVMRQSVACDFECDASFCGDAILLSSLISHPQTFFGLKSTIATLPTYGIRGTAARNKS